MIGTAAATVTYVINNKNFNYTNLVKDSYVKIAELEHIKQVLGEDLYNDIDDNPGNYTTLLTGYLNETIAYYTVYEALPFLNLQITDKGIMINDSETASQSSSEQRGQLRNSLYSMANALRDDMMSYIRDNTDTYTLYESGEDVTNKISTIGGIIINK